ncbi:cobalt ECF transporter T component CbiQ [Dissulfurispira thermophila]|uniref:Cobalt ECF transporter T component CbiQ n=1 Tax=Dissulfurispira thermophila TaxID=2715679 RepID=A0A7G1H3L0_9BACT|nr:cobalt ECF transporter T component CbiQ [Dissulfurispira thermophila]BCB97400.1 cobalt ECF transporter T component CbiQ [Dissulfurispira thermophila]
MEIFSECFKKEHMLSKIDARVKILVSLAMLLMVLSYKGFTLPVLITLTCLFLCINMKIPLKVFLLRFSEPVFIASIILILKLFFSGKELLFSIPIPSSQFSLLTLTGYKDGLMDGLMIASRVIGAVSVVVVIGFSTPFTEFVAGLSWLKVPKGFTEILMFSYRYIFVLLDDAMVIYNAQKNRLGYSSIRRGLGSFGILAGSLILKVFEHSHNITVSMIQRGYDGNMPVLKQRPFKLSEIILSVVFITAMGIIWKI